MKPLKNLHNPAEMPIFDHLEELRKRLIHSLAAIAIAFLLTYRYSQFILDFLMQPVLHALQAHHTDATQFNTQLHFSGLIEPFFIHLKVAFFAGLLLASPYVFFQIWRFAAPGLYRHEKVMLAFLAGFSVLMFVAGMAFAYYAVFPMGFAFFLSYSTANLSPILMIKDYLSLIMHLLLAFGLIFQMPLVILILAMSGIITARQVAGFWRYAIILIAIFSAAMTPGPDLGSMFMMMVPMVFLYGVSIILAALFGRKKPVTP